MKILGLHYDRPFLRLAVLELKGKKFELQSLKSFVPTSSEDVKRLYRLEQKELVATGIKSMVRKLNFKISSAKKVEEGLPFQIESLTSLSLEDLVHTSQISLNKIGAEATVFLASKESLVAHLREWNEFSIYPDLVTSIPQALLKFTQFRCPHFRDGFVVHLGSEEWTCIWTENGLVKKSFVIEEGIESLLSSLWEDRKKVLFQNEVKGVAKQIDLLQLKPQLNPQLSTKLESLRSQLSGVLYSFQTAAGSLPLFFTGRTDSFSHLCQYLLQTTPEISLYEPPIPLSLEEHKGAIAIGLAIEAASKESVKVQFLKEDFIPARQWKKAGLNGLALITASLVLSTVFCMLGMSQLETRKEAVAASLQGIVGQMDKQLESTLFKEGIEEGVFQAVRAIQKYDKEASFLLQAPTVSEVLAWLANSPFSVSLSKASDPIDVIDLKYNLVSLPKIGCARDPYLAKVELQFRVKNSMSARKFHEALLSGDYLVDANQEITWESLTDGYQTSFYLKNRAPHVL